jgi:hypothetical protein
MKKVCQLLLIISCGWINAQWEGETANVMKPGRREVGFFVPFKMGLSNGSEISINKFLIMPSVSYKTEMSQFKKWQRAYRLQIAYPTTAMRWLQSPIGMKLGEPDMFALISPEFTIPQMLSVYGEMIGSTGTPDAGQLTLSAGAGIGINGKKLPERSTIDLPIIYPRFSVYHNKILFKVGGKYLRQFKEQLSYKMDYDMYLMPGGDGRYAFEQNGLLVWTKSNQFRILLGYKLIAGEYPFGSQAHLFPFMDFQFGW